MDYLIYAVPVVLLFLLVLIPMQWRVVVPTNEVHIVQRGSSQASYGAGTAEGQNGNVYYLIPSWIPVLGVQRTVMPLSIFALDLDNYEAYDQGRLPFVIDVKAFFRITNSAEAAQRVSSFKELEEQLMSVVQGAVRAILASNDIEEIMQGRGKFADEFTKEVAEQLVNWGVSTVKNIELMDIRDTKDSKVIHNIMAKKKSFIEMESRQAIAENNQRAQMKEIEAQREVDLQKQEALQTVGLRTVANEQAVALASEARSQTVKEQQKVTKEKEMAVKNVEHVQTAEINARVAIVKAEQEKQTTVLTAEATLEKERKDAEATVLKGDAKAGAERAMLLAPVEAQTTLAKEIGGNQEYQTYLITIREIEAKQAIGVKQAEALNKAEIKMIVNTGEPATGMNKVMDLFSSKGGTELGAMLEGLKNTPQGEALIKKFIN